MAKKPAEPKQKRLLDEVLAIQGKAGVPRWQAKLTEDQLAQLEEIREARKQKKIDVSLAKIQSLVSTQFGITVPKTSFAEWMNA
jgi:hypothetical protein